MLAYENLVQKCDSNCDLYGGKRSSNAKVMQKYKKLKCPLTKWTNKMWNIPTTDCYSTIKKSEERAQARTCMNLQNIMLREINPSYKKTKTVGFHFCEISRIGKFKGKKMITGVRIGANEKCPLMSCGFLWGVIKMFWN